MSLLCQVESNLPQVHVKDEYVLVIVRTKTIPKNIYNKTMMEGTKF